MPLIHKRYLQSQLNIQPIPKAKLKILQNWQESIENQRIHSQKETALHSHFIQNILIDVLGYQGFADGSQWTLSQEQKIRRGSVDVALGHFDQTQAHIIAPFELKGADTKDLDAIMSGRNKSPVQQAWEYANGIQGGGQWILVSNYLEIRLYAASQGNQVYEHWDMAKLTDPAEYARLQWLLSAKQLLSGNSEKILQGSELLDNEITDKLYQDYKALREQLIQSLRTCRPLQPAPDLEKFWRFV